MASDIARTATELHQRVIAPLVTGKQMQPLEPIEPGDADRVALAGAGNMHGSEASWVDLMRVRHVRLLCPVDALPAPGRAEWLMAAALNNVLIAANAETNSLFSPRKTRQVLDYADAILELVAPIDTAGEALRRHATFAPLMRIERVDVHVGWWSGSAVFRGRAAPGRLLAWPELRRVQVRHDRLALPDMVPEADNLCEAFDRVLATLLAATPLTALASCTRARPKFSWTPSILALIATDAGHALAVRALRHSAGASAVGVLRDAMQGLQGCGVPWAGKAAASVADDLAAYQAATAS